MVHNGPKLAVTTSSKIPLSLTSLGLRYPIVANEFRPKASIQDAIPNGVGVGKNKVIKGRMCFVNLYF